MYRNKFQMELTAINMDLVKLGTYIVEIISNSVTALLTQNVDLCNKVLEDKAKFVEINDIEARALRILLMQQPVAGDLRTISTAMKIVTDLDRIGRQAREICHIVLNMCDEKYSFSLNITPQMGELAKEMVRKSIQCFVDMDIDIARSVIAMDNRMDDLFVDVKSRMIQHIKNDTANVDVAVYFIMIAKYLEKIGDHAENIAQWVVKSRPAKKTHKG